MNTFQAFITDEVQYYKGHLSDILRSVLLPKTWANVCFSLVFLFLLYERFSNYDIPLRVYLLIVLSTFVFETLAHFFSGNWRRHLKGDR